MLKRMDIGLLARYLLVTALSASIMLGIPYILHEWLSVEKRLAVAVAFVTAFISNFVFARIYIFRSRDDWRKQFARFSLTSALMRIAEYLAFLAIHMWTDIHYVIAVLMVLAISFTLKFVILRTFVFATTANEAS